jgi:hypothetical protein
MRSRTRIGDRAQPDIEYYLAQSAPESLGDQAGAAAGYRDGRASWRRGALDLALIRVETIVDVSAALELVNTQLACSVKTDWYCSAPTCCRGGT